LTAPQNVKEYSKPSKFDTKTICTYFEKKGAVYEGNVLIGKMRYAARREFGTTRVKTGGYFKGMKWDL
jgi:hypothetical protein